MDKSFEHIGNVLVRATDEELHRVLVQYMDKTNKNKEQMLQHFSEVADCRYFDYYGQMTDIKEEEYT